VLNEADFSEWCRRLALAQATQAAISEVRLVIQLAVSEGVVTVFQADIQAVKWS
jgi:hypothetical protein